MKTFAAIALALFASICFAQNATTQMPMGQKFGIAGAPFCHTEESMVEVARAEVAGGIKASAPLFRGKEDCAYLREILIKILRVSYQGTASDGSTVSAVQVEIALGEGKTVIAYMLTDVPIARQST